MSDYDLPCGHSEKYAIFGGDDGCLACSAERVARERDAALARLAEAEGDAALGRIAIKFVDRAGDVCEVDPADRICREFHAAMSAEVERQFRVRMQRDADSATHREGEA